jgi:UDP-N-acetylglucosamine acyltransferase
LIVARIDPTAHVADEARIADDVEIGPYCVIGSHVEIGNGGRLLSHVNVAGHTTIGARAIIYSFASLGTPPQSTKYRGGPTRLVIGADCEIREAVTINTGTEDGGGVTEVGDRCLFMVGSHVGHDCRVGNDVSMANNTLLGGHVTVGNHVVFGGQAAVRQFVRIGEGAMIVGLSGVRADIIPWALASGPLADLIGLNVIGMQRRGFSKADIHRLRQAYRAAFFGPGTFHERVEALAAAQGGDALVGRMVEFIRSATRPLTMAVRRADVAEAP